MGNYSSLLCEQIQQNWKFMHSFLHSLLMPLEFLGSLNCSFVVHVKLGYVKLGSCETCLILPSKQKYGASSNPGLQVRVNS